jgi:hypothetical protein
MDRPQCVHLESLKLRLELSRIAGYYCAVVILLSWLSIGLAALPWYLQALLAVVVSAYGWRTIYLLHALKVSVLEFRNGSWFLHKADGLQEAILEKKIFLGAGIILLPFTLQSGKNIRLLLWPDSADAEGLRRLRATLLALY